MARQPLHRSRMDTAARAGVQGLLTVAMMGKEAPNRHLGVAREPGGTQPAEPLDQREGEAREAEPRRGFLMVQRWEQGGRVVGIRPVRVEFQAFRWEWAEAAEARARMERQDRPQEPAPARPLDQAGRAAGRAA